MNERTPTPEELRQQSLAKEEREDDERWADYIKRHPVPVILKEDLREAGPEITEFEAMVSKFEAIHSLEKLHSITAISTDLATLFDCADDLSDERRIEDNIMDYEKYNPGFIPEYKEKIAAARAIILTPEEKEKFEIKVAAKRDLAPIVAKLNTLQKETNISADKYEELNEKKERLARAVGMINKTINPNKVDHER